MQSNRVGSDVTDIEREFQASLDAWAGMLRLADTDPDQPARVSMLTDFLSTFHEAELWQILLTAAWATRALFDMPDSTITFDTYLEALSTLGEET